MNLCSGPGIQFWDMETHELVSSIPDGRIMMEGMYVYVCVYIYHMSCRSDVP
jgi:hypothetical protein